jgi:cell division transport system permease protein
MRNALRGVERSLFWIVAFAAFAAAVVGFAARAVDRVAAHYDTESGAYAIVRVLAPEGPEGVTAAETALAASPHVVSTAPMTAGRAANLLNQWGQSALTASDMPPLRLIEVELSASAADTPDMAGEIVAALAQGGVTGEFIAAPANASRGLSDTARQLALWGAVLFAVMMAVIVLFAARGLAARRREMVTVMCDLGATEGQAAGKVADEATMLGLYAGLIGAALASVGAFVVLLLAMPGASLEALPAMIRPLDALPLVAAPLGTAIAAGIGARAAAAYFHGQAARLG